MTDRTAMIAKLGGHPITRLRSRYAAGIVVAAMGSMLLSFQPALAAGSKVGGAITARTVSLNEQAKLRTVHNAGPKTEARGPASGTYSGQLTLNITILSATRVKGTFTASIHGGTLSGVFTTNYEVIGATSHFSGTVSSLHGTGLYRSASNRGIVLRGTQNRRSLQFAVTISGRMSL